MNIDINLLPEELRPRPPVETRTLLVIVLILALAVGCYFLFQAKGDADARIADLNNDIAQMEKDIAVISSDSQIVALTNSISQLRTATRDYERFANSRIIWGDALERVQSHKPKGVEIGPLSEKGDTLVIQGTAGGWDAVTSYGRALDRDTKFTLAGWPTWKSTAFSLTIEVAPGGGR